MATPEIADELVIEPISSRVALIKPLERIAAGLALLAQEAKPFDLATAAGEREARAFRAKCVKLRTSLDDAYETANAPILKDQRDARALRDEIKAKVSALEDPVDKAIKADELRREEERKAKARAEAARVALLRARLASIHDQVAASIGSSAAELRTVIDALTQRTPGPEWQEFQEQAIEATDKSLARLRQMLERAEALEAEQQRLAAERAELDRKRIAQEEAAKAERQRIAAEEAQARRKQAEADAAAAAERKRQDDVAAAQRAESARLAREAQEKAEAEAKVERDRVDKAQQAERDRIARERADLAEREAAQREAEARLQRERDALAAASAPPAPEPPLTEPPAPAAVPAPEPEPAMTTGAIGQRLGFSLPADFIETVLGIPRCGTDKRAVLWAASDWPRIKAALVNHIEAA